MAVYDSTHGRPDGRPGNGFLAAKAKASNLSLLSSDAFRWKSDGWSPTAESGGGGWIGRWRCAAFRTAGKQRARLAPTRSETPLCLRFWRALPLGSAQNGRLPSTDQRFVGTSLALVLLCQMARRFKRFRSYPPVRARFSPVGRGDRAEPGAGHGWSCPRRPRASRGTIRSVCARPRLR